MQDISSILKEAYNAASVIMIPGSGSYGMEAVARQFARNKECVVIRNGYFSYRWSAIFDACDITKQVTVLNAQKTDDGPNPHFKPHDIDQVIQNINEKKANVVFAPHVETSTGMILPDDYIKKVGEAVHNVGGLFVLDCIASGTHWVDMEALNVDVLISAPQKGWSGPACCALVMLSKRAKEAIKDTQSNSFVIDLKKWLELMEKYESGGFMYHATVPSDALCIVRDAIKETKALGFQTAKERCHQLGTKVRSCLESNGCKSVAAPGYHAPGVVVVYDKDATRLGKFKANGLQIAAGVPFMINEPQGMSTFRIGLFGLDKWKNVDETFNIFEEALKKTN